MATLNVSADSCAASDGWVWVQGVVHADCGDPCPSGTIISPGCNSTHAAGNLFFSWTQHIRDYATVTRIDCHLKYTVVWAAGAYGAGGDATVAGLGPWVHGVENRPPGWQEVVAGGDQVEGVFENTQTIWTGTEAPALSLIHAEIQNPQDTNLVYGAGELTVNVVEIILYGSGDLAIVSGTLLPYLIIPRGQGQDVDELQGASSVAQFDIEAIDLQGELKAMVSDTKAIGQHAFFRIGFPDECLADFVTLHAGIVTEINWTSDGRVRFIVQDFERFISGQQLWIDGGPTPLWEPSHAYALNAQILDLNGKLEIVMAAGTSGATEPAWPTTAGGTVTDGGVTWEQLGPNIPPDALAFTGNGVAVSDRNPRWVRGNPIDIYLVALQNELGVGQDDPDPSTWQIYDPVAGTGLINPNTYLDIPQALALRNGAMSGYRLEFKITRPEDAKIWLDDQVLKPLGLYTIVRANGVMTLKTMKSPADISAAVAWDNHSIIGIPENDRLPVINYLTFRMGVDDSKRESAARDYQVEYTFESSTSVEQFRYYAKDQVESEGARLQYGGFCMAFLRADRTFRRHGFATPRYAVKAQLRNLRLELGDYVLLTHPLVLNFKTGTLGLVSVLCEVVDRQPALNEGSLDYRLVDTRFMSLTQPFQIAAASANVPNYPLASPTQQQTYMFIAGDNGKYSTGALANTIF